MSAPTTAYCWNCRCSYAVITGHRCADSLEARELREQLAQALLDKQTLESGIKVLEERILTPIAKHFSGEYNQWRRENPKATSYVRAGELLIAYLAGKPI